MQRVVGLALCHHYDGESATPGPNRGQHFDAAKARHLLVEQDQVVALTIQQLQSVVAIHHGIDVVSLAHEEDRMRTEQIDLVIHPQDPTFVQAASTPAPAPGILRGHIVGLGRLSTVAAIIDRATATGQESAHLHHRCAQRARAYPLRPRS